MNLGDCLADWHFLEFIESLLVFLATLTHTILAVFQSYCGSAFTYKSYSYPRLCDIDEQIILSPFPSSFYFFQSEIHPVLL